MFFYYLINGKQQKQWKQCKHENKILYYTISRKENQEKIEN